MLIFRIFGAGEWGLAVANHLSLNNNVEIYLRDKEKIELYKKQKADKGLGLTFNDNISFYDINSPININLVGAENFINIIASSSSGFVSIIENNLDYFKSFNSISWITKGLDHTSGLLFHQIVDEQLSNKMEKCVISGPSFARDLVLKKPLEVTIASTDSTLSNHLISAMSDNNFNLVPTKDIIGTEVSGVIKNVSAILAGSLTANEYSDEYITHLIELSQNEVKRITKLIIEKNSNYQISESEIDKTLASPACSGDLHLTCFYNTSRNRQLGLKLTDTCNVKKLISKIGTVDGYLSTATLFNNKDIYGNGHIINAAYDILYNHLNPSDVLNQLFD